MSLSIIWVLSSCFQPLLSAMADNTSKTFITHNNNIYLCLFIYQKQITYVVLILLLYYTYY